MNFEKELENYIKLLDCSIKDICDVSEISYSLVNRYINGKRKPKEYGKNFNNLVNGLYQIAIKKNINLSKDSIYNKLEIALIGNTSKTDFDLFIDNFNTLQDELSITTVELSRAIGYDSSFISRIKNKERKPSDIHSFLDKIISYIVIYIYQHESKKDNVLTLLNCDKNVLEDEEQFKEVITNWLCSKHTYNEQNNVLDFLTKLDNFDLNDYISTDFSKIKTPTIPLVIKSSKTFYGIAGRKQAEGEFLKTTLLSKSTEPIFFYSDLPISKAGEDEEFKKKWVYAISVLLKRGLHLNIVHNLNRPVNELLLGLENWIPVYMSGSITPYYFKNLPSNFFNCSQCTSGSIALTSECIKNNEAKSRFYLTTKKDEVDFEKEKSKYMLSKATPLMDIYKESSSKNFDEFLSKERKKDNNIQKIKKDIFNNIDFYTNDSKWVIINKTTSPKIHFVIKHEKLVNAINIFLLS